MRRIYKYDAPNPGESKTVTLPWGSRFLAADVQRQYDEHADDVIYNQVVMWFEVEPDLRDDQVDFVLLPTGAMVPSNLSWLATVQDRTYVWHLYQDHHTDQRDSRPQEKDDLLIFLAARLVNIYGEDQYTDYIQKACRLSGQEIEHVI